MTLNEDDQNMAAIHRGSWPDRDEFSAAFSRGSTLLIEISAESLNISLLQLGSNWISTRQNQTSHRIGPMDFFHDWHLNTNREELIGVSIYFPGNTGLPNFDRLIMNHPNIVREGEGASTIFFSETRPESAICLYNQDFDGTIFDMGDQIIIQLPCPDRFQ